MSSYRYSSICDKTKVRRSNSNFNYKNIKLLHRYIGITGKVLPRNFTKLKSKQQRCIAKSIRRARKIGLLPFVWLSS